MRLSEMQDNFKQTMLDTAHLDTGAANFQKIFKQDTGICLENRMKVYRNNVIRSLTDAAMAALPMTKKLVGEEFLEKAMRDYVVDNLPTEGNLNLYGITFPNFIKTYESAKHLPYLHDFTKLEWAWEAAYYAQDDLALDPEALTTLTEEQMPALTFSFRKSFTLIESDFPLDEIVDFCRAEDQEEMHELSSRGAKLMVFRPGLTVEIHRLNDNEYIFLKSLRGGKTIHETAVTIAENDPNFNLADILQKHLSLGTFSGFDIRS